MKNLNRLFLELKSLYQEGTLLGVFNYLRFKYLNRKPLLKFAANKTFQPGLGIIGAGTYTASIHLPCLKAHRKHLHAIVSQSGETAQCLARVYRIDKIYSDLSSLMADRLCDSFLIATPHYLHPEHIIASLDTDKYTYCEKPVAIDQVGIDLLIAKGLNHPTVSRLMVGFNRRFAPVITRLMQEKWINNRKVPAMIIYKVNFGPRVRNSMSDPVIGGGRIHGAVCHYVDMIAFLAKASIVSVCAFALSDDSGEIDENSFSAVMTLSDGSIATLVFTSEGRREFDVKEEVIVYSDGHVARITDYCNLYVDGKSYHFSRHQYGALFAMRAFLSAAEQNLPVPIGLKEGIVATQATLAIQESLYNHGRVIENVNIISKQGEKSS